MAHGIWPAEPARRMISWMSGKKSIAAKNSVASQIRSRTRRMGSAHGTSHRSSWSRLEKDGGRDYTVRVRDSFKEFEATSLFCGRCRRATPVRKRLLLVLPTGNKYDYTCGECGAAVGGKMDSDASDFYATRAKPPDRRP